MTASKRTIIGSDLARVDAHEVKPHEYEDIPALTDDDFARGSVVRRARPKSANPNGSEQN